MSFVKYLKHAFLNRWNLLLFLGGLGFAAISGRPDVVAPIVVAGELAYVTMLGSHPKFQRYVDRLEAGQVQERGMASSRDALDRILRSLPEKSIARFEALRKRCLELGEISRGLKDPSHSASPLGLEEAQLAGLDKLLWINLRLLFTEWSLERFLASTSEEQIQREIERLEERLKAPVRTTDEAQQGRIRKSIEDTLETSRARLANYAKARDNYELVRLEIERLESKIRTLSELAVNRQEPDFVSTQVDQVASSLLNTERTLTELRFATGLELADDAAPPLLAKETLRSRGG